MIRSFPACCAACVLITLASCENSHRTTNSQTSSAHEVELMNGQEESPPPRDTVPKVMQAKLAYAQAMLEGIALADFTQIQVNARSLKHVSESAEWLAHESVAYFDLSADFRRICDAAINDAQARDLQAVTSDYAHLTQSCVACHTYLRSARPFKDLPGSVSLNDSTEADTPTVASVNSAE